MFCKHCGNQVEENAEICTKCGCKVKEVTTKPAVEINTYTIISLVFGIFLYIISLVVAFGMTYVVSARIIFLLLLIPKSTFIILSIVGVHQTTNKKDNLLAWITLALNILTLFIYL